MRNLVDIRIEVLCTRENRARFSQSLLVLVHTTSPQVLSCVQSPGHKLGLIAVWSRFVIGCPLLGVKQTSLTTPQMSASDPKRTLSPLTRIPFTNTKDYLVAIVCSGLGCPQASRGTGNHAPDS
jgi:hypothetical protein